MNAELIQDRSAEIIIVGEALIDLYQDGTSCVAGAPLNVAWHLNGLGLTPRFVSSVGDDVHGRKIRDQLRSWGLDDSDLQRESRKATGTVRVDTSTDDPTYEIATDVAFDFVHYPHELAGSIQQRTVGSPRHSSKPLLYYGSLGFRGAVTRDTICRLRDDLGARTFVDINLREGHYDESDFEEIISGADHLKCSTGELEILTGVTVDDVEDVLAAVSELTGKWLVKTCWITDGADGAHWINHRGENDYFKPEPIDSRDFVDSVGAGDAFAAAVIRGIANNEFPQRILRSAVQFSAKACTISGATTAGDHFYDEFVGALV